MKALIDLSEVNSEETLNSLTDHCIIEDADGTSWVAGVGCTASKAPIVKAWADGVSSGAKRKAIAWLLVGDTAFVNDADDASVAAAVDVVLAALAKRTNRMCRMTLDSRKRRKRPQLAERLPNATAALLAILDIGPDNADGTTPTMQ